MKTRRTTSRQAIATALGNRSLRGVLPAYFLFACGENGVWLAVSIFAYRQGGITAVGIVSVAQLIPAIAVAPLGAALFGKLPRPRALTLGYALQFLTNAALAVAMFSDSPLPTYAAAVVASCAVTLIRPVHNALLPQVAQTPEELTASNSLSSVMEGLGLMIGPALTALSVAVWGPGYVPALFALTSALAALLARRARVSGVASEAQRARSAATDRVRKASHSLAVLVRERGTSLLVLLGGAQFLIVGILEVFYVALAVEVLGKDEGAAGLLASAGGIGALVGATLSTVLIGRRRMTPGIVGGMLIAGIDLALIPHSPTLAVMVTAVGLTEAGMSLFDVAARTLLQRVARDELLAGMFGVQESLQMASLAAGAAVAPILAAQFGVETSLLVVTGGVVLAVAVSWFWLRRLDRRANVPDPARIELLVTSPIFSPLPQHELEQVAGYFASVTLPAGSAVIREGDVGDRFYVLASGEAVVEEAGRHVATFRAGDYFGEIALLRDVPRTATVRATTEVGLLALERDDFLAVVSGSARSSAIVDAEVDRRLAELRNGRPPRH